MTSLEPGDVEWRAARLCRWRRGRGGYKSGLFVTKIIGGNFFHYRASAAKFTLAPKEICSAEGVSGIFLHYRQFSRPRIVLFPFRLK
jgi:hypothetical protein